jgi:hypothetical protein
MSKNPNFVTFGQNVVFLQKKNLRAFAACQHITKCKILILKSLLVLIFEKSQKLQSPPYREEVIQHFFENRIKVSLRESMMSQQENNCNLGFKNQQTRYLGNLRPAGYFQKKKQALCDT